MTRLGFIGVGKHAQKMAAAFRECGAEVVVHCRAPGSNDVASDEWGEIMHWQDQVASTGIDALIICAPPEITTEVALACANAGKRCVATKPLMIMNWDTTNPLSATEDRHIYVDIWRLYSPAWQALKAELRGTQIQSMHVDFYGDGPVRSFSGLLDYGPHALAFVADLLGSCDGLEWKQSPTSPGRAGLWRAMGKIRDTDVQLMVGNGARNQERHLRIRGIGHSGAFRADWMEDKRQTFYMQPDFEDVAWLQVQNDTSAAIRAFCRAFLNADPSDTLRLSCEAMRVLMPLVS